MHLDFYEARALERGGPEVIGSNHEEITYLRWTWIHYSLWLVAVAIQRLDQWHEDTYVIYTYI